MLTNAENAAKLAHESEIFRRFKTCKLRTIKEWQDKAAYYQRLADKDAEERNRNLYRPIGDK